MKRIMNTVMAALAIFAGLAFATPIPAQAGGPDVFTVVGTGSNNPPLPCTGCAVHGDFTLAGAGVDAVGTASCTFDGTANNDTILQGSGDGTISCSGAVNASGSLHYDRTGPIMTWSGGMTINGSGCICTGVFVLVCLNVSCSQFIWVGIWICL